MNTNPETEKLQAGKSEKNARLFLAPTVKTVALLTAATVAAALPGCAQSVSQRREQAKLRAEEVRQEIASTDDPDRKDELWDELEQEGSSLLRAAQNAGDSERAMMLYLKASKAFEIEGDLYMASEAAFKAGDEERAQNLHLEASEDYEARGDFESAARAANGTKDDKRIAAMYVKASQLREEQRDLKEAIEYMARPIKLDENNEEYIARWRELHRKYSLEMESKNILTIAAQSAAEAGDAQRAKKLYERLSAKLERKGALMDQIIDAQNRNDDEEVVRLRDSLETTSEEGELGGYYVAAAIAARKADDDDVDRQRVLYGKAAFQLEKQGNLRSALEFFYIAGDQKNRRRVAVILSVDEEGNGNFSSAARYAEDAHDDVNRIKSLWRQAWVKSIHEKKYDDAIRIEHHMKEKGYIASTDELYGSRR